MLAAPIVAGSFSTTWDTGVTTFITINLGACPGAVYWEEIGNSANNGTTASCDGGSNQTVNFPSPGIYRVDFSGSFTSINLQLQANRDKFRTVEQWGDSTWTTFNNVFSSIASLAFNAVDAPNLSLGPSMRLMFNGASNFNSSIGHWDVSQVTNMERMFTGATSFNQPLNNWDVSNVTTMQGMFTGATSFNQPLNNWDVSNVTDMGEMYETCGDGMFTGATSFNQPLNNWNVSNVVDFQCMFSGATSFNQPLDNWDVSSAENFTGMFEDATSFNQPLNNWPIPTLCLGAGEDTRFFVWRWLIPQTFGCVNTEVSMQSMFHNATSFNQPLDNWDVSYVSDFRNMFDGAAAFDQSLGDWPLSDGSNLEFILDDSGITTQNYSATLIGWAARNIMPGDGWEDIGRIPATYCDTAQAARDQLTNDNGWDILDLGSVPCEVIEPSVPESNDTGSATKVGERLKRLENLTETSTLAVADRETFVASVKDLIAYLTKNEELVAQLTPQESKRVIIALRDVIFYLLSWLPGV